MESTKTIWTMGIRVMLEETEMTEQWRGGSDDI